MNRTGTTGPSRSAEPRPAASAIGPFRRLCVAVSLSSLGFWLSLPALTALAGTLTRDEHLSSRAQAIAGVLVLLVLPALLLAPVAGAVTSRLDRRITLVAADVLRFAVVVSVPLVDAVPWTMAAAFLVAFASLPWIFVVDASLPVLVPEEGREEARRSMLRAGYGMAPVAAVVFAVLALIADAAFGVAERADLPLYVTAVVFLAAAATTFTASEVFSSATTTPPPSPSPLKLLFQGQRLQSHSAQGQARNGQSQRGRRGAKRGHPEGTPVAGAHAAGPAHDDAVRGLTLAATVVALVVAALIAVARLHARNLGGGDAGYGSLLAGLATGLAFGLFLGPRMLDPFSRRRLLGLTAIAAALALVPIALVQNLVVVVFLAAFAGMAAGVAWALGTRLPDDVLRAFAYLRAVALLTALVVFAAVPPLAGLIGDHRLELGGATYDASGTGLALLIVAVLSAPAGVVAYRRLDDRRGIPLRPDLAAALRGYVYTPPEEVAQGPAVIRDRGVFIAFEGGEGAGKTTQARLAAIWLRDHGYDVVSTHEPGATKIGMRLRAMLLDKETTGLSARAETLLYAADRADHVANVIRPALERGAIVVSDRYVDSSLAYQGFGRRQEVSAIARVNAWAIGGLVPDLTILLEVPTETGLGRLASPADRIEGESYEFHERVREGFRALAEADPDRYLIVDASRPQAEIAREIQYRIREILPDPVPAGTEDVTSTFPAITDV